jgi:oligopeptide/dipeptide ABC transporter ATP-binding protein
MSEPILAIQNLRTSFFRGNEAVLAVDGLDLALYQGQTLGLVGESGCGKSVTALSILRLIPPAVGQIVAGSIQYQGQNILSLPEPAMRRLRGNRIAMIFQEPQSALNPVLSVGYQIVEVIRIHEKCSRPAAKARAISLLERVGLAAPQERYLAYPHQLSGGMRQRVLIAMALACQPDILIADEPTTALDVTIQAQILDLLRQLQEEFGMAILLISHDLGVIAQNALNVAVMYAGQIVESAQVNELFQQPCHPYTRGLLAALPMFGRHAQRLATIPGMVPSLADLPPGCRFQARCTAVFEPCQQQPPPLYALNDSHQVRCFLYASGLPAKEME